VLLFLAASCGPPEGTLALRLLHAGVEDPYVGLSQLQVRALDRAGGELQQFTTSPSSTAELGIVRGQEQRFEIRGFKGAQLHARGQTRLLQPQAAVAEELVPFSTLAVTAALPAALAHTGAFKIDGALDEWSASPSLVLDAGYRVAGPSVSSDDLRVEVYLAWAGDYLHIALRVQDDCPALRTGTASSRCAASTGTDRVALGFDGTGDGGDVYGAGDLWVEVRATSVSVVRGQLTSAQFPVVMAVLPDDTGWVLEGSIALGALGRTALTTQDHVGFDLVIFDEDPEQAEPTVLRWSGYTGPVGEPTPPKQMRTIGFAAP
jgi:hypothetical protein